MPPYPPVTATVWSPSLPDRHRLHPKYDGGTAESAQPAWPGCGSPAGTRPSSPIRHSATVPSPPPVTATVWPPSCPIATACTPNVAAVAGLRVTDRHQAVLADPPQRHHAVAPAGDRHRLATELPDRHRRHRAYDRRGRAAGHRPAPARPRRPATAATVPSSSPVTATVWPPSCPTATACTANMPSWPGCGSPTGTSPSSPTCHSATVPSLPPVTATVWPPSCPIATARTPKAAVAGLRVTGRGQPVLAEPPQPHRAVAPAGDRHRLATELPDRHRLHPGAAVAGLRVTGRGQPVLAEPPQRAPCRRSPPVTATVWPPSCPTATACTP